MSSDRQGGRSSGRGWIGRPASLGRTTLSAVYNGVYFCLKVRETRYRIVRTPWAELYHDEPSSPDCIRSAHEVAYLKAWWGVMLTDDPHYNPNLTLQHEDFGYRTRVEFVALMR